MWPFLLVLAIVPMIFFWSDSVREMFPQVSQYLPEKSAVQPADGAQTTLPPELADGAKPGQWYVSQTDKGYVAWVMSADGQYRIAVGCHKGAQATLQVTHLSGATMPAAGLHLNYQYGALPLTQGYYTGADVVNGVAQFKDVYLQDQSTAVLAQFTVPTTDSNTVARAVANTCAAPAEPAQAPSPSAQ